MAATRDAMVERVMDAQRLVARSLLSLAEPNWLELDLTLPQLKSLMILTASGPLSISRMAELLHLQRSATSTLIDHLVRVQLVARTEDADDRRRTLVDLTPSGRTLVTRLRQGREDSMRKVLSRLSDDDLVAIARILRTIAEFVVTAPEKANPDVQATAG